MCHCLVCFVFFFNDTATTEIYTLSLHDALPISRNRPRCGPWRGGARRRRVSGGPAPVRQRPIRHAAPARPEAAGSRSPRDRKSTRLNSSHANISYAVFCLKKKKTDDV